jgi:hypothetical protein
MALADKFRGLSEEIERRRREPDGALPLGEAVEMLARLRASGHRVTLVGGARVSVQGTPLTAEQVERVKNLKPALLRLLAAEAPEQPVK